MKVLPRILLLTGFLIGLGIFSYPTLSNWLAAQNQIQVMQSYDRHITGMSREEIDAEWTKARNYNDLLQDTTVTDPFTNVDTVEPFTEYAQTLNIAGIMGYIEIPAIKVELPIYHGVAEEVLAKGVGHIKSTALPVGGERTHAVLSAHSGLAEAKLFSDLEKIIEGDYFLIYILDEILAYRVDQIKVVEPDDISLLMPVAGKDYVTLLTCTPIGINSQRLLVRGERCEMPEQEPESGSPWRGKYLLLAAIILAILLFLHLDRRRRKQVKEAERKQTIQSKS